MPNKSRQRLEALKKMKKRAQNSRRLPIPLQRATKTLLNALIDAETHLTENIRIEDAPILLCLCINDSEGRGTAIREAIDITGFSAGKTRMIFERLSKTRLIAVSQQAGRTRLYRPSAELTDMIRLWASRLAGQSWNKTRRIRSGACAKRRLFRSDIKDTHEGGRTDNKSRHL